MKLWLIAILRRLLVWLDPPPPDAVRDAVRELIAWAETFAVGTSGEYKRHAVLAKMQKTHPAVPARRVAWLIEQIIAES